MASPEGAINDRASNIALWIAFALTSVGTGGFFLAEVHRSINRDSLLAIAGLLARTGLFVALGLLLEALLMHARGAYLTLSKARRSVLHVNWVAVMLLCVALLVDLLVFAFAGYHIPTALRILFSDGPEGIGKVVEATGLSPKLVVSAMAGLAIGIGAATALSKVSRRISARANIEISRRAALRTVFISVGILALVEMVAIRFRNPFLWDRELRSVPLAFAVVRPAAELASFRVSVQFPSGTQVAPMPTTRLERKPDVFFLIVESLRKDTLVPEIMPRFSAFAHDAWTFEHAITTGNVTHYSWYGMLCARLPAYFEAVKAAPGEQGSRPLGMLRDAGYRVHLFATPDTSYQKMESIVFGHGGALLDEKYHPTSPVTAERDDRVLTEFAHRMATEPPGGGVYVVALDSTHFGYEWGANFVPPFTPYAKDISIAKDYELNAQARAQVINRYKSSVAWADTLVGRFLDALSASRRLENSLVVITGDHGEAFWEHGSGTHGSDLGGEQLEVAFAMRLPGRQPMHFDGVFSHLDLMPSLLFELGLANIGGIDGLAVQDRMPANPADGPMMLSAGNVPLTPRAALSFQGWNERTYRFALTTETRRMLFELDHEDPRKAQRLLLIRITTLQDESLVDRNGHDMAGADQSVLRDLPSAMDSIPFLKP